MPLLKLPNELLLDIAERVTSKSDLNSLTQTSRHLNTLIIPILMNYAISETRSVYRIMTLYWAAATKNKPLVKVFFDHHSWRNDYIIRLGSWTITYDKVRPENKHIIIDCLVGIGINAVVETRHYHNWMTTALQHAAAAGRERMVRQLLGMGATRNWRGGTWYICKTITKGGMDDHVVMLLLLIAIPSSKDFGRPGLLHYILRSRNEFFAWGLLVNSVDVHTRAPSGKTILHYAAEIGCELLVRELLRFGADPFALYKRRIMPISLARATTAYNTKATVRFLLLNIYGIDFKDENGKTPLHMAAEDHDGKLVKLLLERGANITARDLSGRTPLHLAVKYESQIVIDLLLENGASVFIRDYSGKTALHTAVHYGVTRTVSKLLREGANINAQDKDRLTPLYVAARRKSYEMSLLLLENGADVGIKSMGGKKPEFPDWFVDDFAREDTSRWHQNFLLLVERRNNGNSN